MSNASQHEIARLLNLSQPTVSRSLANHPAINAETKALVWETAIRLGYQQKVNQLRRGSRSAKPFVVGIVISIPHGSQGKSETFQPVLKGLSEKSTLENVMLDVLHHEPADLECKSVLRRIKQAGWQGCILFHPMPEEVVQRIEKTVPCVSIIENYRGGSIDCLDVDQSAGIFGLVKQLVDAGHRRIGFYSWVYQVETPWVQHRVGSFVEALYRFGLSFNEHDCVNIRLTDSLTPPEAAARVAERIRMGVTAYCCAADHQAYPLIADLGKLGLKVPKDCSITGFDGIETPPGAVSVSTVNVPYDELGRSAINQLLRRVEQPTAPRRHLLVDGELVRGDSVAKAPAPPAKRRSRAKIA
ncbi:MAG: LacI family DNA-binding transcriptional regulator [Opitutales bacterium]